MEKQKTLSEYIHWLHSMTTTELLREFPREFHLLDACDDNAKSVTKILANDAILWHKVVEYNKALARNNTPTDTTERFKYLYDELKKLGRNPMSCILDVASVAMGIRDSRVSDAACNIITSQPYLDMVKKEVSDNC